MRTTFNISLNIILLALIGIAVFTAELVAHTASFTHSFFK